MRVSRWSLAVAAVHLSALLSPVVAHASDSESLWAKYDDAFQKFEEARAACDEAGAKTTRGDRICRDAVLAGRDLSVIIESILSTDTSIAPDDREAAVDALLTTRQIMGSYLVEVGECSEAVTVLDTVLTHPLIGTRQIVRDTAQRWRDQAVTCVEEQKAQAAQASKGGEAPSLVPGLILVGVGVASLGAGVAWDLSLGDTRDKFDACREDPACGEDPQKLKEDIDGAKVPIAILYGVGGASLIGGAVWTLLALSGGEDAPAPESAFVPMLGPDRVGFTFAGSF